MRKVESTGLSSIEVMLLTGIVIGLSSFLLGLVPISSLL